MGSKSLRLAVFSDTRTPLFIFFFSPTRRSSSVCVFVFILFPARKMTAIDRREVRADWKSEGPAR